MEVKTRIQPKKPHFFKPILHDYQRQLSIPASFMRYLKGEKPDEDAILYSNNILGRSWRVMVDGGILKDGWGDFAKEHDLRLGDFLVFRHQGGMVFHVVVFDPTACEKQYPSTKGVKRKRNQESGDGSKSCSSDSTTPSTQFRSVDKQEAPSFTVKMQPYNFSTCVLYIPAKFARCNGLNNRKCVVTFKDKNGRSWPVNLNYTKSSQVYIGTGWNIFSEDNKLKMGDVCSFKLVSRGENVVMEVVIISRSDGKDGGRKKHKQENETKSPCSVSNSSPLSAKNQEPPSFTVTMKLHNFTNNALYIPMEFTISNGLMDRACVATFMHKNGRSWQVKLCHNKKGKVYISSGWTKFLKDNRLKVGDVCTFKLISMGENLVMEVDIIYYSKGNEGGGLKHMKENGQKCATLQPNSVDEQNEPSFTTRMQLYNFTNHVLHIPAEFARSNGLINRDCMVTLKEKSGQSWQVHLNHKKLGDVYISSGWTKFLKDNRLEIGDVCTFKLVSTGENVVIEVVIIPHCKRNVGSATPPQPNNDEEAPYFTSIIKPMNVSMFTMYIPSQFVRTNGLMEYDTITLRDQKGKSWPAPLHQNMNGQVYIGRAGWRKLSNANRLKLGDECTFKLVSTGNVVVLEVLISRSNGGDDQPSYVQHKGKKKHSLTTQLIGKMGEIPYFTAEIQVHNKYNLVIPMQFARSNGLLKTLDAITLIDEIGKSWKVNMLYFEKSNYVRIGWHEFSEAKNLKQGDVCTLKLLSEEENVVFEIVISRFPC